MEALGLIISLGLMAFSIWMLVLFIRMAYHLKAIRKAAEEQERVLEWIADALEKTINAMMKK